MKKSIGVSACALVAAFTISSFLCSGCVTKKEFQENVKAWRGFHDTVAPDLVKIYDGLPEPSRSNRLKSIEQDEKAIQAAEVRAGLREDGVAPVGTIQ